MGAEIEGLDDLSSLLESGKLPENATVEEIEALLAGDAGKSTDAGDDKTATGTDADGTAPAKDKGDEVPDNKTGTPPPESKDEIQGGEPSSAAPEQEPKGPIVNKSGTGTIPYGVLEGTRERLRQAEENLRRSEEERQAAKQRADDLERQLTEARTAPSAKTTRQVQAVADQAGITDAQGRPIDVTTIDVESLRGEFPAPIVDMLATFQKALQVQHTTIERLTTENTRRAAKESLTEEEQIQADIDAVPALAQWAADPDPAMFNRAVALDNALLGEARWQNASRVDRYKEVARILGGEPAAPPANESPTPKQQTQQPAQVNEKVSAALARAAAHAAPISHSDLPAGTPAAQSEHESLEGMDVLEIAAKMENMTPEQQQAYIDRFA